MAAKPTTRDFFELVKAIGESKSKQEEDRIISDEVAFLKKTVPLPMSSKKKLKELVVRLIYVEMLGQDASFAYIKAVELCAAGAIAQKRVGYLAAALCLSPAHEFRFMLVNQIQVPIRVSSVSLFHPLPVPFFLPVSSLRPCAPALCAPPCAPLTP
jgi:AP-4 complex subunit epsilon-1